MEDVMKLTVDEVVRKGIEIGRYSPTTREQMQFIINSKALDPIRNFTLEELTAEELRKWVDGLIEQDFSAHTINNYFCIVNRTQFLFTQKKLKVKKPTKKYNRVFKNRIISEDELTTMLLYADIDTAKAILLSYYACMNRHEILTLTYRDVYYDNNAICLHSRIEHINGIWKHSEDTVYDQTMRFAIIPKEVMEFIGRGHPQDLVIPKHGSYLASKCIIAGKKAGLEIDIRTLMTASLYKKALVNPIGIFENQAAFCFAEDERLINDCINEYLQKKRSRKSTPYNFDAAFCMFKGLKLKDITKQLLEKWLEDISSCYELSGVKRNYFLLEAVLFDCSKGKFHLDKYGLKLYSNKIVSEKKVRKKPIDLEATRALMDKADSELKKAMLLSGYGDFTLTEIVDLKVKNVDKEKNVISQGKKSAPFSKAAIRFIGKGDPDEPIVTISAYSLKYKLKILCEMNDFHVTFTQLKGSFMTPA